MKRNLCAHKKRVQRFFISIDGNRERLLFFVRMWLKSMKKRIVFLARAIYKTFFFKMRII